MEYFSSAEPSQFVSPEALDRVRRYHSMKRAVTLADDMTPSEKRESLIKVESWYDKNIINAGFTTVQIDIALWADSSDDQHPDIMVLTESEAE